MFRFLFRGREKVYPHRFVRKKTGKAGYSPVCGNEWVRGVCEKPRIKCSNRSHQEWRPVTDEVIRQHLSGKIIAGGYPMLLDESCHFLAVDFDGNSWADDQEECGGCAIEGGTSKEPCDILFGGMIQKRSTSES